MTILEFEKMVDMSALFRDLLSNACDWKKFVSGHRVFSRPQRCAYPISLLPSSYFATGSLSCSVARLANLQSIGYFRGCHGIFFCLINLKFHLFAHRFVYKGLYLNWGMEKGNQLKVNKCRDMLGSELFGLSREACPSLLNFPSKGLPVFITTQRSWMATSSMLRCLL